MTLRERLAQLVKITQFAVVFMFAAAMILTPFGIGIRDVVAGTIVWAAILAPIVWVVSRIRTARS